MHVETLGPAVDAGFLIPQSNEIIHDQEICAVHTAVKSSCVMRLLSLSSHWIEFCDVGI